MPAASRRQQVAAGAFAGAPAEDLPAYCARPSCRNPYTRTVGPGRPQLYCSDICRRSADREARQLRQRLAHYEAVAAQLRADLSAFEPHERDETGAHELEPTQHAAAAVHRAAGLLDFLGTSDEPLARALRGLHDAVAPIVLNRHQDSHVQAG